MPGKRFTAENYRYSFNGKENDSETESQDYGMRIYNPRLGRFFSVDPISKSYPMLTPYQFASNRPIDGTDLDGLEYSSSGKYFSSPENKYRVNNKLVIAIQNSSKIINDVKTVNLYKDAIKKTISQDQSGGSGTFDDPVVTTYVQENKKGSIKINFTDAVSDKDGNVATGFTHGGIGETQKNVTDVSVTLDGEKRPLKDIARTASREQGHVTGLKHPFHGAEQTDIGGRGLYGKTYELNLMNSYGGSRDPSKPDYNPIPSTKGHDVSPQQRTTITNEIRKDTK